MAQYLIEAVSYERMNRVREIQSELGKRIRPYRTRIFIIFILSLFGFSHPVFLLIENNQIDLFKAAHNKKPKSP
jgi:hypothetical protein